MFKSGIGVKENNISASFYWGFGISINNIQTLELENKDVNTYLISTNRESTENVFEHGIRLKYDFGIREIKPFINYSQSIYQFGGQHNTLSFGIGVDF
jgi:hypothetical protein